MTIELTEWEIQVLDFLVLGQFQELLKMKNMNDADKHSYFVDLKKLLQKIEKAGNNR